MSRGERLGARSGRMAAAVALALTAGCARTSAAELPPAPHRAEITMAEMTFEHPATVPKGRVVFRVHNAGRIDHRLILSRLGEDFPPISAQLAGTERRRIEPLAGIPDTAPGADTSFAVDLQPGRYALVCLVVDADGVSHARKGMASEFRAT